jgi:sodium-dependent dicarboxylate transporter 2/3/5
MIQKASLIFAPIVFILLWLLDLDPSRPEVSRMAAVAGAMAILWMTESIPLAATALIPMVLFPLMGILSGKATAAVYFNSTIFLFLGGFLIALAMERWNLHKRIALVTVLAIGGGPSRIIFGFMVAGAFLSMWISNTATAVMMLPIALSIIKKMEAVFPETDTQNFSIALLLTSVLLKIPSHLSVDHAVMQAEYKALGPMTNEERKVLTIFALTAVLWIFSNDLVLGSVTLPGWGQLLPFPKMIDDGTVAVAMALILFFSPTKSDDAKSAMLLDPAVFTKLPWAVILLFGGGFALAAGFQNSGLSAFIGSQLKILERVTPVFMVATICTTLTFLTEMTSNTATTQMILPILSSIAVAMKTNPLLLLIPATLSSSCAFMMPIATPPNAIIFGSGRIRMSQMIRTGFLLNILGIMVVTAMFYFVGLFVFSIDPATAPMWALAAAN